jgi:hypothetical protein
LGSSPVLVRAVLACTATTVSHQVGSWCGCWSAEAAEAPPGSGVACRALKGCLRGFWGSWEALGDALLGGFEGGRFSPIGQWCSGTYKKRRCLRCTPRHAPRSIGRFVQIDLGVVRISAPLLRELMTEMDTRGIGVMRRTCKRCGNEFEFEYRRGRPRERCWGCQPPGTRMVGAVKLMNEITTGFTASVGISQGGRLRRSGGNTCAD